MRHRDFVICTGSQEDFSDSTEKFQASWPFVPQSYLSHVMIFQNTNFSLLLPLLNPGYFSLRWVVRDGGGCRRDWSYTLTLIQHGHWDDSSSRASTHFLCISYICILSHSPTGCLMCFILCRDWFCRFGWNSFTSACGFYIALYILLEIMTIKPNKYFFQDSR